MVERWWAPGDQRDYRFDDVLDELDGEYPDRLILATLDVDAPSPTPPQFGIRSIPTLILFKNGVVAEQLIGAVSKRQLKEFLDKNL